MIKEEEFLINLGEVRRKIEIACTKEGRKSSEITLLPFYEKLAGRCGSLL